MTNEKEKLVNVEKVIEPKDSVELSINAKGQYSGKVKVYAFSVADAMKEAIAKAKELETLIAEKNQ
jgi:hypothetical protein